MPYTLVRLYETPVFRLRTVQPYVPLCRVSSASVSNKGMWYVNAHKLWDSG